jgi:hypothetical protein
VPAPDASPTITPAANAAPTPAANADPASTPAATATPAPATTPAPDAAPTPTQAAAAQKVDPNPPTIDAITDKLKAGDTSDATRTMIGDYFAPLNMADSKAAMDKIREQQLLPQFIDAAARDANGKPVTPEVKAGLQVMMNTGKLDVYAETLARTPITVGTFADKDGNPALQYVGKKEGIQLDQRALSGQDAQGVANILAHETFHAFSDAHGGQGYTALDEGLGIAAREYAFSDKDYNLSEMVYGTKNFYRDKRNEPNYQLGDFSKADPKLKELMGAFASRDYSHLAFNNPTQLQSEYQTYWKPLDRNRDDWSDAAVQATAQMLAGRPT